MSTVKQNNCVKLTKLTFADHSKISEILCRVTEGAWRANKFACDNRVKGLIGKTCVLSNQLSAVRYGGYSFAVLLREDYPQQFNQFMYHPPFDVFMSAAAQPTRAPELIELLTALAGEILWVLGRVMAMPSRRSSINGEIGAVLSRRLILQYAREELESIHEVLISCVHLLQGEV